MWDVKKLQEELKRQNEEGFISTMWDVKLKEFTGQALRDFVLSRLCGM